jgi:hypothetical protein
MCVRHVSCFSSASQHTLPPTHPCNPHLHGCIDPLAAHDLHVAVRLPVTVVCIVAPVGVGKGGRMQRGERAERHAGTAAGPGGTFSVCLLHCWSCSDALPSNTHVLLRIVRSAATLCDPTAQHPQPHAAATVCTHAPEGQHKTDQQHKRIVRKRVCPPGAHSLVHIRQAQGNEAGHHGRGKGTRESTAIDARQQRQAPQRLLSGWWGRQGVSGEGVLNCSGSG